MGTINDKLTYLNETKTAIKNAIVAKGVSVSANDTFRSYANKIGNIQGVEDLNTELSAQDTALSTQETKITQLEQSLNNKVALDLTSATSDANATAGDIVKDKTAYVNGEKIVGIFESSELDWSEIGYNNSPVSIVDGFECAKYIHDNWNGVLSGLKTYKSELVFMPISNISGSNMVEAFADFRRLMEIPSFDTSNITTMSYMCRNCTSLYKVNSINTSNVTNMQYMFSACLNLHSVNELDAGKLKVTNKMFESCVALKDFGGLKNLGKAYTQQTANYSNYTLDLSSSTVLTYDSLMNVINNLYDLNQNENLAVNGVCQYKQSLILGSTNLAKLTAEEIAIATNKGWNVT